MYADFKKKTYGRAYLAKAIGLKNLDYISELLKEIEDSGLIRRDFIYGNEYVNGHINKELRVKLLYEVCEDCDINWFPVAIGIIGLEGTSKDKGFALKLRAIAYDDTLKIGLNKKDLASAMEVSVTTLRKKMNAIEKIGLWCDGLVDMYFPICERCYLDENRVETVKQILVSDKNSKTYKQVVWYLQNKMHFRRDANKRLDNIMAGFVGQKNKLSYGQTI